MNYQSKANLYLKTYPPTDINQNSINRVNKLLAFNHLTNVLGIFEVVSNVCVCVCVCMYIWVCLSVHDMMFICICLFVLVVDKQALALRVRTCDRSIWSTYSGRGFRVLNLPSQPTKASVETRLCPHRLQSIQASVHTCNLLVPGDGDSHTCVCSITSWTVSKQNSFRQELLSDWTQSFSIYSLYIKCHRTKHSQIGQYWVCFEHEPSFIFLCRATSYHHKTLTDSNLSC